MKLKSYKYLSMYSTPSLSETNNICDLGLV